MRAHEFLNECDAGVTTSGNVASLPMVLGAGQVIKRQYPSNSKKKKKK